MEKVELWAIIENDQERKVIMSWVRAGKFQSYSEIGTKVSATLVEDPNDPDWSGRKWGAIHVFEQYAEHSVFGTNV